MIPSNWTAACGPKNCTNRSYMAQVEYWTLLKSLCLCSQPGGVMLSLQSPRFDDHFVLRESLFVHIPWLQLRICHHSFDPWKFFDLKWIWDQVCFRILACHESRQKAFSARIVSCEACSEQLLRPKRKPWISVRICWDDTCTSILWTSRAQIWWVKREAFFAALWWTLHCICTKHTAHICSLSSYPRTGARSAIYHIRN